MRSYAKINFGLKVIYRYPNGYHHINGLFLPIDFFDSITFTRSNTRSKKRLMGKEADTLAITWEDRLNEYYSNELSPYFSGRLARENILAQTFRWFGQWITNFLDQEDRTTGEEKTRALERIQHLRLNIVKRIPSPAGLGGGSSNAARLLQYLLREVFSGSNERHLRAYEQLEKDSMGLGADIPFFFAGQPALISGIGRIQARCEFPRLSGILGVPPFGFSTAFIYKELNSPLQDDCKSQNNHREAYIDSLASLARALSKQDAFDARPFLAEGTLRKCRRGIFYVENDLMPTAGKIYPDEVSKINFLMDDLAATMYEQAGRGGPEVYHSMSGSGSSFFAMGAFSKSQLNPLLPVFRKRYPDVHWQTFSVL